jgi:hypothetical protein
MGESKYDKAVNRARGIEEPAKPAAPTELTLGTVPPGMLVPAGEVAGELAALVASGAWEAAPQLFTLPKGSTIRALLEGNGPPAEFTDEETGEIREVKTWILSHASGARVSILSSAQLDRKLPAFVGSEVAITRGEDVRKGTTIYTDYLVLGAKRTDGTPRSWSTKPALPALVGSSSSEPSS